MRNSKKYPSRYLLLFFFLSLFFYTPFNYSGWTPICLILSFILFLTLFFNVNIKIPAVNFLDIALILFLTYFLVNIFINYNQPFLNFNHFYAYYTVILLYYFTLRFWIFNYLNNDFKLIMDYLTYGFILICLSGILDYILMQNLIYLHEYLPMPESNTSISGVVRYKDNFEMTIWSRAKGFYTEPTLLSYALVVFGPIVLQYNFKYKSATRFIFLLLLFIISLILSRSVTAYICLIVAFILSIFIYFQNLQLKNIVKKSTLFFIFFLFLSIILLSIFLNFYTPQEENFWSNLQNYILHYYDVMTRKINGLFEVNADRTPTSALARRDRWEFTLAHISDSNKFIFGFGPGYESAGGLEGGSTLNWFLNVLLDYGLIGLFFVLLAFYGGFHNILNNHFQLRLSLTMSLFSCMIYLFTQTGFYFPNLWIIFVLSGIKFK